MTFFIVTDVNKLTADPTDMSSFEATEACKAAGIKYYAELDEGGQDVGRFFVGVDYADLKSIGWL